MSISLFHSIVVAGEGERRGGREKYIYILSLRAGIYRSSSKSQIYRGVDS